MSSSPIPLAALRGRGAAENPPNRFERLHIVCDPDVDSADDELSGARGLEAETDADADEDADEGGVGDGDADAKANAEHRGGQSSGSDARARVATEYYRDASRSIIAHNDSPDVGFTSSINPYRGCEHGCIYCYARPTHEFLGLSAGLDFETKLFVKTDAPALLRRELMKPSWKPTALALSGVTDPYQPIERTLRITRGCLEVLADFRQPVGIITKNALVTRDIDVLKELAAFRAVDVALSVTTLDETLRRVMEPRAATPERRLDAIARLNEAGIPAGVMMAPIIPGLNDHEIPKVLARVAQAGARFAGFVMLRLPYAVSPLFEAWLGRHFPERKQKVLDRIRGVRGGNLNDPRFGSRMRGSGPYAEMIADVFAKARDRAGIPRQAPALSTDAFRRPTSQPSLF